MISRIPILHTTRTLLLIVATVGAASEALAQQPSQAQVNAIRQSCRNDYMAHCSSVTPGGAAALGCLQQHASSLSAPCQQAVSAIKAPAPAAAKAKAPPAKAQTAAAPAETAAPATPATTAKPAPAQSKKAQLAAVGRACGADYRTHCHGIRPGTGAAADCLKRNAATLSPACQHAPAGVAAAKSKLAAAPAAAPAATPAAAPAAAPAPAEPPPLLVSPREEMFILRTSCRRDYIQFCRGLRFGAGRVASCLHYNAANLSPPCQAALAALREGR
jgi:pyruvate/2-oxoglutarate dehydrogenase complex dihydrolipoamide acyltransferase (E2) component